MPGLINFVAAQGQGSVPDSWLNNTVQCCLNVAQLRQFTGAVNDMQAYLLGFNSEADGGQGNFYWNATSTATDNGGVTVVQPNDTPVGRWLRVTAAVPVGLTISTITYIIDGAGSPIATGVAGSGLEIDFPFQIISCTLLALQSGSIALDIWSTPRASYPPVLANSICAADFPTITSAQVSVDTTLTGWTTTFAAGASFLFNVRSVATVQNLTIALGVSKL